MYPYWIEIGSFKLPTFGPMVVLGFLAAHFVMKRELPRIGVDPELSTSLITAGIVGGLVGAKLYFVIFELPTWATWSDTFSALFSGSGLTWHGGFAVATLAVIWTIRRHVAPLPQVADVVGLGLALGYAIGRIGCQLAGDGDYGVPTDLPWAMTYPNGVVPTTNLVHPVPVYETLMGLAAFVLLWFTRCALAVRPGLSFALYLILAGTSRFAVEFIRLNAKVLMCLTGAQLFSLGMIVTGAVIAIRLLRRSPSVAVGEAR
ncbi:MAG: prolipoprotein diacylglyceryl transferase [Candidatus Latescibacterota bacterium]|nr:prolipoprotein diacylglyceryl transferase [Candidatus Latescibacterota bacterium]